MSLSSVKLNKIANCAVDALKPTTLHSCQKNGAQSFVSDTKLQSTLDCLAANAKLQFIKK